MRKEDKALIIERLGQQLKEYAHFYLVDVTGLNAEATSNLRRKCFAEGIKMVVVKNTLLEKTFDKADVDFSPLVPVLKGTTAVMSATLLTFLLSSSKKLVRQLVFLHSRLHTQKKVST